MFRRALGISLALALPATACDDNETPPSSDTAQSEDTSNANEDSDDDAKAEDDTSASEDAASEDAGPDTSTGVDTSEPAEDTSEPAEDIARDASDIGESDVSGDVSEGDSSEPPVTWAQVHPIFKASCSGCHGGGTPTSGSGGHAIGSADIGVAYDAAMLAADRYPACDGLTIGECALLRIEDGTMPPGGGSSTDDAAQALILEWIADGMLE